MEVLPIEIKSGKDYYRHNAMDNVLSIAEYVIEEGYVFCNGDVENNPHLYVDVFAKERDTKRDCVQHRLFRFK